MKRITSKINLKIIISIFVFTLLIILQTPSGLYAFELQTKNITNRNAELFNNKNSSDGFILFAPRMSTITYLINNSGEVVHRWESTYKPREGAYLLENGNLLRPVTPGINPTFPGGGSGGKVEELDWNGTVIWDFEYSTDQYCLHHDIEPMPNGNILLIAWELKTNAEAIAEGRNPNLIPTDVIWPTYIIEVDPSNSTGGNIVWEWHVWDHLIQDYDQTKENYGVVKDHPELIDINYGALLDWNHVNSIDYNEDFDQIILSVHSFSEIWVIDHSTTLLEAAGHTGGKSGKGGDILYRWGNPKAYHTGGIEDQKLFWQHDAKWIQPGLSGEGNILIFNNGFGRPGLDYSSVDEIIPPVDDTGNYSFTPGTSYGPDEATWVYTAENPADFFGLILSGAQRLPNGNTLICNGPYGVFIEVTPEKETVWEYVNRFPNPVQNNVFKIHRYPLDYPGLKNLFENPAPRKPSTPDGTHSGEVRTKYTFSSSTTDPEGDQIYYLFDWGDNSDSGWIGPYKSGDEANASHSWIKKGSYNIKVKAKDIKGVESVWSNPLSVTMPKNQNVWYCGWLERFPRLQRLLDVLGWYAE